MVNCDQLRRVGEDSEPTAATRLELNFELERELPFPELLFCDVALGRFFEHEAGILRTVGNHTGEFSSFALYLINRVLKALISIELRHPGVIKAIVSPEGDTWYASIVELL